MGPNGMRELGELCLRKSHYALECLTKSTRFERAFEAPFFKEFVVRDLNDRTEELLRQAEDSGFFAGISLGRWYPELDDCVLVSVTEKRTRAEIDGLAHALAGSVRNKERVHA
jgi:glycine dehydrogenase subunit 1